MERNDKDIRLINKTGKPHPDFARVFTIDCQTKDVHLKDFLWHYLARSVSDYAAFEIICTTTEDDGTFHHTGFVVFNEEEHLAYVRLIMRNHESITIEISYESPVELILKYYEASTSSVIYGSLHRCDINLEEVEQEKLAHLVRIISEHKFPWPEKSKFLQRHKNEMKY